MKNHGIKCPNCGSKNLEIPTVDIGVGEQQCGPAECLACGWQEAYPDLDVNADAPGVLGAPINRPKPGIDILRVRMAVADRIFRRVPVDLWKEYAEREGIKA